MIKGFFLYYILRYSGFQNLIFLLSCKRHEDPSLFHNSTNMLSLRDIDVHKYVLILG